MKKILAALAAALLISGCSSSTHQETNSTSVKKVTITNPLELKTKTLDMSGYEWLNDDDPPFIQISMEESCRMYEEGGTGIVLYSYPECEFCKRGVPVLDQAAKEMGVKIYYVWVYEPEVMNDKENGPAIVKRMETDLDSILEHSKNKDTGEMEPEFYTPEVVAVKNGKIVGHHTGLVSDYKITGEDSRMNEEQTNELKNIYEELIEEVAD